MSQLFIIQSPCLGNCLLISPRGICRSLEITHQRNTHSSSFWVVQCLKEPWYDRNLLYRRNPQEMPNLWTCFLGLVFIWYLLRHKNQFKLLFNFIISPCKFLILLYWVQVSSLYNFSLTVMLICLFLQSDCFCNFIFELYTYIKVLMKLVNSYCTWDI